LAKIYGILNSGGKLILSTPNTKSFEWLIAGKSHVQLLPPGHVCLYNVENIKVVLESEKFKVLSIFTPNPSLDISYIESRAHEEEIQLRLGPFLAEVLANNEKKGNFEKYLKENRLGGNMVVVAEKI
jgi:hypothetical protein